MADGITEPPIGSLQMRDRAKSLQLRDSRYASRNFGLARTVLTDSSVPKPKFMFFIQFILSAGKDSDPTYQSKLNNRDTGIVFLVKNIDRPKINLKTETLNQYNKKRIIQTGVEYQNLTCVFHDDVGDKLMEFWKRYFGYYYGDGNRRSSRDWINDQVNIDFWDDGNGWGYLGDFGTGASGPAETHFIDSINLFTMYGGRYTSITYVHPKITLFDHDNNDYEQGREGIGIRMSFDYEGIIYNLNPTKITEGGNPGEDQVNVSNDLYPVLTAEQMAAATDFLDLNEFQPQQGEEFASIRNYNDIKVLRTNRYGSQTGNQSVTPLSTLLATVRNISDTVGLVRSIANQSSNRISSSSTRAQNFSFGSNQLGLRSRVIDIITATSASGKTPSQSAIQQATGVRNQFDTFGVSSSPRTLSNQIQQTPFPSNSGFDTNEIVKASAAIGDIVNTSRVAEQTVSPGQTRLNTNTKNPFSQTMGTLAVLAQAQGLVETAANNIVVSDSMSGDNTGMFNKLPNGQIELTERGAFAVQASRSPTSAYGYTKKLAPNTDPNNRELLALSSEINNLATIT